MNTFILFSHSGIKETINAVMKWEYFTLADHIVVIDAKNQFFIDDETIDVVEIENLKIGGNDNIVVVLPAFDAGVSEDLKAFTYLKILRCNPASICLTKQQKGSLVLQPWRV